MNVDEGMVETLKSTDSPRAVMLSIINGVKLAPHIKIAAYMLINTAKDSDIEKLRSMFVTAIGYLENNNAEGLASYLTGLGLRIDPRLFNGILSHSPTDTSKDQ